MSESRTQRARRLGRISLEVLRSDRRLLVFPLVSAMVSLGLGAGSFLVAQGVLGGGGHTRRVLVLGGIIASYPVTFVTLFSGVALACMLARKLDGREVSPSVGWRTARERIGIIAAWTLLVCNVGAVLRLLEEYLPVGGRLAAWLLDLSWSLATLFAVPVLAYERLGPRATLRRSAEQQVPRGAKLRTLLRTSGQTVGDLRLRVRVDLLAAAVVAHATANAAMVTEAQIAAYYAAHSAQFCHPETRDIRLVLTKTRPAADSAKRALGGGQSFRSVARRWSLDVATRGQGGRLRGVAQGVLPPPLNVAVFRARRGILSGPVRSRFGYYVFRVEAVHPSQQENLAQAAPVIRQQLVAEQRSAAADNFVRQLDAKWRNLTYCRPAYTVPDCGHVLA